MATTDMVGLRGRLREDGPGGEEQGESDAEDENGTEREDESGKAKAGRGWGRERRDDGPKARARSRGPVHVFMCLVTARRRGTGCIYAMAAKRPFAIIVTRWSFHRRQYLKRCSRVCDGPTHHQHLSSEPLAWAGAVIPDPQVLPRNP
jgi:hypothetical protein